MNTRFLLIFGLVLALSAPLRAQTPPLEPPSQGRNVAVITLQNELISSNAAEALKLLDGLDPDSTEAIILQINCFSPMNWDDLDLMMRSMSRLRVPLYAFVDAIAVDSGALLALACDHVYMAPASIFGGSPDPSKGTSKIKRQSFSRAAARSMATDKGRDLDMVEAIWNPEKEYRWNGELLTKPGELLMISGAMASRRDPAGKPLLADGIVRNVHELHTIAGLESPLRFLNAQDPKANATPEWAGRMKSKEPSYAGKIVAIEIGKDHLINPARFDFTERALLKAEREGAQAIILNLNTPGGLAVPTADLANTLTKMSMPVYAYVNPSAVSAGALTALGADAIYMHPVSAIGAAAVISQFGDLEKEVVNQFNAVFVPFFEAVAEANGHAAAYAEHFIIVLKPEENAESDPKKAEGSQEKAEDDATEDQEVIGTILSLSSQEATSEWEGNPPLAKGLARSIEDLIRQEGLDGELIEARPLGFESLAQWVTKHASILLLLAFLAGYAEMRTPGFGVFGLSSLALFSFFFFGHFIAGKMAGLEMVAVFLAGITLMAIELFLTPGTLVAGLSGAALILIALVHTMADAVTLPTGDLSPWAIELDSLWPAMNNLVLALGGSLLCALLLARFFPQLPFFEHLILRQNVTGGAALQTTAEGQAQQPPLLHAHGISQTMLRPTGKAFVNDLLLDVTTEGDFLPKGAKVKIIGIEGSKITVRAV